MSNETDKPVFTKLDPPERKRIYHFDGATLTLENVTAICVCPSGTHRLETADGRKWIVDNLWNAIELDVDEWTF